MAPYNLFDPCTPQVPGPKIALIGYASSETLKVALRIGKTMSNLRLEDSTSPDNVHTCTLHAPLRTSSCCAALSCDVLRCASLCFAALCHAVFCRVVSRCVALFVLCCLASHRRFLCLNMLCSVVVAWKCITQHYATCHTISCTHTHTHVFTYVCTCALRYATHAFSYASPIHVARIRGPRFVSLYLYIRTHSAYI